MLSFVLASERAETREASPLYSFLFGVDGDSCFCARRNAEQRASPTSSPVHAKKDQPTSTDYSYDTDGAMPYSDPEGSSSSDEAPQGRLRDVLADAPFASAALAHATTFALRQGGRNLLLALVASQTFGYTPLQLGQLFGAMAMADLAGVGPASWLSDKIADKRYVVCGSLVGSAAAVLAVAYVALQAEASGQPDQLAFLGAVSLWALSTAALGPTLPAYAADLVPEAQRGLGLAAFRSAGDVGFVGAPLALGIVADAFGAPAALAGLAGASVASAGAFAVLNRRR